jgi:hypothetical protein
VRTVLGVCYCLDETDTFADRVIGDIRESIEGSWEMIDRTKEKLYTFRQLAKRNPGCREGRTMDPSTPWRMAHRGSEGVKLEYLIIGSTAFTSMEALDRYSLAVRAAREARRNPAATPQRTPTKRSRAAAQAQARLAAKGA